VKKTKRKTMAETSIKTNDLEVGIVDPEKMNGGDKKLVIVMGLCVLVIMIIIIWFAIDTPDLSGFHDSSCGGGRCGDVLGFLTLFSMFCVIPLVCCCMSWVASMRRGSATAEQAAFAAAPADPAAS